MYGEQARSVICMENLRTGYRNDGFKGIDEGHFGTGRL